MSGLRFDVDLEGLERLAKSFELDQVQLRAAMSRALNRTRGTLRAESARGLKNLLGLRTTTRLRRRIKVRWIRRDQEMEIWYGENDFPVRDFRGRAVKTGDGVSFGEHSFPGAFVGQPFASAPRSVWRRVGSARFPLQEAMVPVKDRMDVFIEDEVLDKAGELLLSYLEHEIVARGIFGVGKR